MTFFSIIIPTYNRASLIGKTIESVLAQQFRNFELIIIDDGSIDNTDQVVMPYMSDLRVTYIKRKNAERGASRNFGASKAKGQYINFFDSDDLMYPNHLEAAYNYVKKYDSPPLLHLAYDYKTPDGDLIYCRNQFDEKATRILLFDNILSCNGVFVRADIAKENPFEENRSMASAEDWALWLRLVAQYPIAFCNEVTSAIIAHDARSIRTINIDKLIERDMFLIRHLESDTRVIQLYGNSFNKFKAERFTFIMLACSEQEKKKMVMVWALKALGVYPLIIFSKRFLASIKNIVI